MKIFIIAVFSLMVLFSCNQAGKTGQSQATMEVGEENQETADVDRVLSSPDEYTGKPVKVEGLVTHVCKHSGKRLHLTSPSTNQMIRVEATGEIKQFEKELEGNHIVVEGIFHTQVIDEDYLARMEEAGQTEMHTEHGTHGEEPENMERTAKMKQQLEASGKNEMISYWIDGSHFRIKE